MKISEVIELLESEMDVTGDMEIVIYDSSGDAIEPSTLGYGRQSTDKGFEDTVFFSEAE